MKALLRLYNIPQFVEVPDPPPLFYNVLVPNPTFANTSKLPAGEDPISKITFIRKAIYYENGISKVAIYEPDQVRV